jgi:NAD(P)-dependent dehydrogenase (short-subunit alcohol dehydrogenase family)
LVNSIHPGLIQTDMGAQSFVNRTRNLGTNDVDAARQLALSGQLIDRIGTPMTSPMVSSFSPPTMPAS